MLLWTDVQPLRDIQLPNNTRGEYIEKSDDRQLKLAPKIPVVNVVNTIVGSDEDSGKRKADIDVGISFGL